LGAVHGSRLFFDGRKVFGRFGFCLFRPSGASALQRVQTLAFAACGMAIKRAGLLLKRKQAFFILAPVTVFSVTASVAFHPFQGAR
jgi:hypothetical protein